MAGVSFSFVDFHALLNLSIGIADRIDESRNESFTILYCDFEGLDTRVIQDSLKQVLRNSDAIVHYDHHYFLVLPYTDKYGAIIVKKMFEDFFDKDLKAEVASYPVDGDSPSEVLRSLQAYVDKTHGSYLECLDDAKLSRS